jgi:hypothetical protein
MKIFRQDSRCPGPEINLEPSEYETEVAYKTLVSKILYQS